MSEFYFDKNQFIIENFDRQKPFSSFLPGLAGKRGIPLWTFYVNRGQGIASFGIENKDRQILEFSPAVKAYQQTGIDGFRTFVKNNGKVFEFFGEDNKNTKRKMVIKRSEFSIEEVNDELGLKQQVTYFSLPNDNLAALVRLVTFENTSDETIEFEVMDGLAQLLPTGVTQGTIKSMANLIRSWMDVYHLDEQFGFFRMRSSSADTAEVQESIDGNFYLSSINDQLVTPIVDQRLVFDQDTSKRFPRFFETHSVQDIATQKQVTANKIPVAFTVKKVTLNPKEKIRINTVIGYAFSSDLVLKRKKELISSLYLDNKRNEAEFILDEMLQEVDTKTMNPLFDEYIRQNYLDNILRGGYPMVLDGPNNQNHVYHLYSRRHGDLERDYNYFIIAPEFYSQGNGSFRDVCQNRRNDTILNPDVKTFNIKMFASFIQADGFNPLSINGSSFELLDKSKAQQLAKELFSGNETMKQLLENTFTPGSLINTSSMLDISTNYSDEELFSKIFPYTKQNFEATFGEGYWIDHWTYVLDLVESFEMIYPDQINQELFNERTYKYFDSPAYVLPRSEKICLTKNKAVRRFGSVLHHDKEKIEKQNMNLNTSNWLADKNGVVIKGSLFEKLFVLAMNKVVSLDPSGIGIEMEAEKPGWNDAMNGLPGLFGSGVSETIELKRLVEYLLEHLELKNTFQFPVEFIDLCDKLMDLIDSELDDFQFWDEINNVKETYRAAIRFGTESLKTYEGLKIRDLLEAANHKLDIALTKAQRLGHGVYPTYLVHEVTKYEPILEQNHEKIGHYGLPVVRPLEFKVRALPKYLEAPARALKIMKNQSAKKRMYNSIKQSKIYDEQLRFYKTSEFLDQESNEIGRGRSFTKGWQERESNFLHMTYKYLLGLLKAGLYEEFFDEIQTNLTIYMDPKTYGRNPLENSSFIASSINPDPFVHGQGFVARLSGSTSEMLSMWSLMMFGYHPFVFENEELKLALNPILPKEFFKDNKVVVRFLGTIELTYYNTSGIDTFDSKFQIQKYIVDSQEYTEIKGELANKIRNREVDSITVVF
jgi:hypothetical protein